MRLQYYILFILVAFSAQSCYDDYELSDQTLIQQEEDIFYDGELAGKIVDENGLGMNNMEVLFAGDIQSTGNKGLFHVDANKVLHQGELLTITTPSKFTYLHTTHPTQNEIHYSTANCYTLRARTSTSADQFNAELNNQCVLSGSSLNFLLNSVPYTNDVIVEGYHINLQEDENLLFFPNASTTSIETSFLNKFEGLHVQWSSTDDQPVTLASGSEISVEIKSSLISPNIAIYYFNPNLSKWAYHAEANHENGSYIFKITEDGYYCIGYEESAIHIDGRVQAKMASVPNAQIDILTNQGELIHRTYSSTSGAWHTVIPSNENHIISVKSFCQDELVRIEIDPNQVADSEILISIDNLPVFKGGVKSCDNELIAGGMLITDEDYFLYLSDGLLNSALPICDNNAVNFSAYSLTSQQESANLSWRPQATNNIQSLFICDVPKDNYIALRADGQMSYYEITNTTIASDLRIELTATDDNDADFLFNLKLPQQIPGSVTPGLLNIQFSDKNLGNDGYATACVSTNADCGFEIFNINHVGGASGDWICGEFTAKFWMRTTNLSPNEAYNNRTITGEFRVKRNY